MPTAAYLDRFLPPASENRNIYIWGAGFQGHMTLEILQGLGRSPTGFIDQNERLKRSIPVLSLPKALDLPGSAPFIIVTPYADIAEISSQCRAAGLKEGRDFVSLGDLKSPQEYSIEIVGPPGSLVYMEVQDFEKVLDKILAEDPAVWDVELLNWHDPQAHPQLPEIIAACRERHLFPSLIVSLDGLNSVQTLLDSPPAMVRAQTAGRGDRARFQAHLKALTEFYQDLKPLLSVEYILRRNSSAQDYNRVSQLCAALGLRFSPIHGYCRALDQVNAWLDGEAAAAEAFGEQLLTPAKAMEKSRLQQERLCGYRDCLVIDEKMNLKQCYNWPASDLIFGPFLAVPLEEALKARADSQLCRFCRQRALHRYPSVCGSSILGRRLAEQLIS